MNLLRITSIAVVICLSVSSAQGYDGSGTSGDPFLIASAADMNEIGTNTGHWGSYFLLTADINLSGYTGTSFNIIGNSTTKFTGTFDGNDHTISNFTYVSIDTGAENIGIFGYAENATIKNLSLIDPNIDTGTSTSAPYGGEYVGSLVGRTKTGGTISGCWIQGGSVIGWRYVGGLMGSNSGDVTDCYATCSVSGVSRIGGLAGSNSGGATSIITNSYATGQILVKTDGQECGGLVAVNNGTIENCFATGDLLIDAGAIAYFAGLVANNDGSSGPASISNCYATGNIIASGPISNTGGLVGSHHATPAIISKCYSTGSVEDNFKAGGLIGYIANFATEENSFWDKQTSGQDESAGGAARMTVEMQDANTFLNYDWDFVGESVNGANDIWDMPLGGGYPILADSPDYFYWLTMQTDPCDVNTVSPTVGEYPVSKGSINININAQPFADCPDVYEFDHWTGDGITDPCSASTTVLMDSDKTITGFFVVATPQCGDLCHPNDLPHDTNHDCIIDFSDFADFASKWLDCTKPECD